MWPVNFARGCRCRRFFENRRRRYEQMNVENIWKWMSKIFWKNGRRRFFEKWTSKIFENRRRRFFENGRRWLLKIDVDDFSKMDVVDLKKWMSKIFEKWMSKIFWKNGRRWLFAITWSTCQTHLNQDGSPFRITTSNEDLQECWFILGFSHAALTTSSFIHGPLPERNVPKFFVGTKLGCKTSVVAVALHLVLAKT